MWIHYSLCLFTHSNASVCMCVYVTCSQVNESNAREVDNWKYLSWYEMNLCTNSKATWIMNSFQENVCMFSLCIFSYYNIYKIFWYFLFYLNLHQAFCFTLSNIVFLICLNIDISVNNSVSLKWSFLCLFTSCGDLFLHWFKVFNWWQVIYWTALVWVYGFTSEQLGWVFLSKKLNIHFIYFIIFVTFAIRVVQIFPLCPFPLGTPHSLWQSPFISSCGSYT